MTCDACGAPVFESDRDQTLCRRCRMTPEVRELYDALIATTTPYYDAKARYEALRDRLIESIGYDAFRDRQIEALRHIASQYTTDKETPQ